jgi:cytochrome b561
MTSAAELGGRCQRPADIRIRAAPAYTLTARVLHWAAALCIFMLLPLGVISANEWGGFLQDSLYDLHRSIGAVVIPIMLLGLIVRWISARVPLPNDIPALQRQAAHMTHLALYALLITQPLVGWIATSAYPAPIPIFGLFELPPLWHAGRALSDRLFSVHEAIGIAIACLVLAHVGAALFHHFVRKDRVLMRMITG